MRMIKACEVMQSLILLFLFAALSAQAAEPRYRANQRRRAGEADPEPDCQPDQRAAAE